MNARDNSYRTPLLAAVQAKLPGHVKRLLMAKADIGISDDQGRTALHYAVMCNSLPCVQAIIETNSNDMNLIDTAGQSALHLACANGSSEVVHYLLSFQSCDINLQDEKGSTALHYSVRTNNPGLIQVLLSKGASVVLKDQRNMTPLQYSIEMDLEECTRILQSI
jgi:ankyrin repeat protein